MKESLKKTLYAGLQYGTMQYWTDVKLVFSNGSFIPIGPFTMDIGNASDLMDEGKLTQVKPILFSIDQLTKPITIGVETFVPIEELLKIAHESWYKEKEGTHYQVIVTDFTPNQAKACFQFMATKDITIYYLMPCNIQLWIIEKLHEWHFNLWLEDGEFIPAENGNYY